VQLLLQMWLGPRLQFSKRIGTFYNLNSYVAVSGEKLLLISQNKEWVYCQTDSQPEMDRVATRLLQAFIRTCRKKNAFFSKWKVIETYSLELVSKGG